MFTARFRDALLLGPWRRRRWMAKALRELDRLDAGLTVRRSDRGVRRRRWPATLAGLVVVTLGAGVVAREQFGIVLDAEGLHRAAPLGRPPVLQGGGGTVAYLALQPGSDAPVTYDPCRPVEYIVDDRLAPPGGQRLLEAAVREVSSATGLVFVDTGRTDRPPPRRSSLVTPRREPVHIAWTTPTVVEDLEGHVAGVAGSTAVTAPGSQLMEYVTGTVALDAPQLAEVLGRRSGPRQVQAIIVHELGHLVGLDHVDDPNELMFSENAGRTELGPGDRRGLAVLGSGRCF